MNKTEARYADELELRRRVGEVRWWAFEPFKLRLADRTFYTPDFAAWLADGSLECVEVKGEFVRDDSVVKFKVARQAYPMFRWSMVRWRRGGGWERMH